LAEIIVKYSLISDSIYIDKLRSDYQLNIPVVRAPEHGAPVRTLAVTAEPVFTPQLADERGLETIINSEDNFLDVAILTGALYCAQAVCRIEGRDGKPLGTGVLIGPELVLTNQHVLKRKEHLESAVARFDYKLINGI